MWAGGAPPVHPGSAGAAAQSGLAQLDLLGELDGSAGRTGRWLEG